MTSRDLSQFIGDPTNLRDPVEGLRGHGRIGRALNDYADLVQATIELVRAQIPQVLPPERRLEGISVQAGQLLQESGLVASVDEGIVVFHERISRDKPGLRAILRKSDRREGRLGRVKRSLAQRKVAQAFKAGEVIRGRDGRIKSLSRKGKQMVARAKREQVKKTRAKLLKRQGAARRRLTRGFATGR